MGAQSALKTSKSISQSILWHRGTIKEQPGSCWMPLGSILAALRLHFGHHVGCFRQKGWIWMTLNQNWTSGLPGAIRHGPGPRQRCFWWVVNETYIIWVATTNNYVFTTVFEFRKGHFPLLVEKPRASDTALLISPAPIHHLRFLRIITQVKGINNTRNTFKLIPNASDIIKKHS